MFSLHVSSEAGDRGWVLWATIVPVVAVAAVVMDAMARRRRHEGGHEDGVKTSAMSPFVTVVTILGLVVLGIAYGRHAVYKISALVRGGGAGGRTMPLPRQTHHHRLMVISRHVAVASAHPATTRINTSRARADAAAVVAVLPLTPARFGLPPTKFSTVEVISSPSLIGASGQYDHGESWSAFRRIITGYSKRPSTELTDLVLGAFGPSFMNPDITRSAVRRVMETTHLSSSPEAAGAVVDAVFPKLRGNYVDVHIYLVTALMRSRGSREALDRWERVVGDVAEYGIADTRALLVSTEGGGTRDERPAGIVELEGLLDYVDTALGELNPDIRYVSPVYDRSSHALMIDILAPLLIVNLLVMWAPLGATSPPASTTLQATPALTAAATAYLMLYTARTHHHVKIADIVVIVLALGTLSTVHIVDTIGRVTSPSTHGPSALLTYAHAAIPMGVLLAVVGQRGQDGGSGGDIGTGTSKRVGMACMILAAVACTLLVTSSTIAVFETNEGDTGSGGATTQISESHALGSLAALLVYGINRSTLGRVHGDDMVV